MKVIPAIDIKDGNCVRLIQGDFNQVTTYSNNPVEQAKYFEEQGAELIHIVDLDGAYEGKPVNTDLIIEIGKSVNIPIEIGGGIRTKDHVKKYVENNINRVIIGTKALDNDFVSDLGELQSAVIIGVDAKDGYVATHGWIKVSDMNAEDFIALLMEKGFNEVIFTDISTDGMLQGPNYSSIESILNKNDGIKLVASGGVSSIDDLVKLSEYEERGVTGAIVGKAVYDGRIDIGKAIRSVS